MTDPIHEPAPASAPEPPARRRRASRSAAASALADPIFGDPSERATERPNEQAAETGAMDILARALTDARDDAGASLPMEPAKRRQGRQGGHKKTKAELELENRELLARLDALQPEAQAAATERALALGAPLALVARTGFELLARRRGPLWRLSESEAEQLGEAWAPVVAMYLPADAAGSPWVAAVLTTGLIVGPRMMMAPASAPAPAEATASEMRERAADPSAPDPAPAGASAPRQYSPDHRPGEIPPDGWIPGHA